MVLLLLVFVAQAKEPPKQPNQPQNQATEQVERQPAAQPQQTAPAPKPERSNPVKPQRKPKPASQPSVQNNSSASKGSGKSAGKDTQAKAEKKQERAQKKELTKQQKELEATQRWSQMQLEKDQKEAERRAALNSSNPGGSGSGPSSSSPTSQPAATTPGSTPAPASPGESTGDGNSNGNAGSGDKGKGKRKSARSKRHDRNGSGRARAAAAVGAGTIAGPPLTPGATGNGGGSNDKDGGSGSDEKSGPPTVVERVIHEIPAAYRYAFGGLAAMVLLLSGISLRERRRSLRTERDMMVDGLTGVGSRKALQRQLEAEWKRSERHDRPLGLLLLDLDDLKEINDAFGHAAGDELLRSAGRSISERVRETDMVARLGGDEFVVVCPETHEAGLSQLALALQDDFSKLKVGVSVGYAERDPLDRGPDDLVARADAAMYAHKRASAIS